jgi:GDP-L-fucose synthase
LELIPQVKMTGLHSIIRATSSNCNLLNQNEVNSFVRFHADVDAVIHLAARVGGIYDNIKYPYEYLVENIRMNTNVIDSCRYNGIKNLIAISSTCVYPDVLDESYYPLKEESMDYGPPPKTNYAYAISKRAMQTQIEVSNKQYGTNYTYIIPSNLYGFHSHYDESSHFLGKLLYRIHEYNNGSLDKIEMLGSSKGKRQFTFTTDVVQILTKWLERGFPQMNCNIANPENLTIGEITEIALRICKCDAKVVFSDETMVGQLNKEVSCEKLQSIWPQEFIRLECGIKSVYERMKHRDNISI